MSYDDIFTRVFRPWSDMKAEREAWADAEARHVETAHVTQAHPRQAIRDITDSMRCPFLDELEADEVGFCPVWFRNGVEYIPAPAPRTKEEARYPGMIEGNDPCWFRRDVTLTQLVLYPIIEIARRYGDWHTTLNAVGGTLSPVRVFEGEPSYRHEFSLVQLARLFPHDSALGRMIRRPTPVGAGNEEFKRLVNAGWLRAAYAWEVCPEAFRVDVVKVWSVIHGIAEAAVLPPPRAQHPAMPVRYVL